MWQWYNAEGALKFRTLCERTHEKLCRTAVPKFLNLIRGVSWV